MTFPGLQITLSKFLKYPGFLRLWEPQFFSKKWRLFGGIN